MVWCTIDICSIYIYSVICIVNFWIYRSQNFVMILCKTFLQHRMCTSPEIIISLLHRDNKRKSTLVFNSDFHVITKRHNQWDYNLFNWEKLSFPLTGHLCMSLFGHWAHITKPRIPSPRQFLLLGALPTPWCNKHWNKWLNILSC
jgi:hypothetical protein